MNTGSAAMTAAECMADTGLFDRRRLRTLVILAIPVSLVLVLLCGIPVA